MKRIILTGVTAMLLLAGCAGQGQSTAMTQPIASAQSQESQSVQAQAPESSQAAQPQTAAGQSSQGADIRTSGEADAQITASQEAAVQTTAAQAALPSASGDLAQDVETYCQVKAQKDAVEIEIDNLEAAYRVGSLDQQSFQSQRAALQNQERELDWQEEMLEDMAEMYFYQNVELPQGDIQSLLDQLAQVDSEKYEQENQEHQLKLQYRNGEISREDFISGMKESIRQEEELDVREELLEDSLERLGWDD